MPDMAIEQLRCPACAAPVVIVESTAFVRCAYCGTSLRVQQSGPVIESMQQALPAAAFISPLPTTGSVRRGRRKWAWLFLGFTGRMGRGSFWLVTLVALGLLVVAAVLLPETRDGAQGSTPACLALPGMGLVLLSFWVGMAGAVKRYHDRNKSGWWALIWFVPVIGPLWLFVECGMMPGTKTTG